MRGFSLYAPLSVCAARVIAHNMIDVCLCAYACVLCLLLLLVSAVLVLAMSSVSSVASCFLPLSLGVCVAFHCMPWRRNITMNDLNAHMQIDQWHMNI